MADLPRAEERLYHVVGSVDAAEPLRHGCLRRQERLESLPGLQLAELGRPQEQQEEERVCGEKQKWLRDYSEL